jgi:membrane dipeptidase
MTEKISTGRQRIAELLRQSPLVDGHNDLPWAVGDRAGHDLERLDPGRSQPQLQTDLPRLAAGGVGVQFWSVYVSAELSGGAAVAATLEQIDFVKRLCARHSDRLRLVRTAVQARQAFAAGRIASLMGAEGGHSIGGSLAVLRILADLGVRYLTLTHSANTGWADSATDSPDVDGLAPFGVGVVREMNRIGMIVDLSHVSAATMRAALDVSQAPVLFTHSSCRALVDNPRNVPDDVLRRLRSNGGVCMVTFVPPFVSTEVSDWYAAGADGTAPRATLAQVADHVEHVREVAGVEHVGLGGDYDGVAVMPIGLEDVSCYPALLAELADRGWSDPELAALAGGNALRVLAIADEAAARAVAGDNIT